MDRTANSTPLTTTRPSTIAWPGDVPITLAWGPAPPAHPIHAAAVQVSVPGRRLGLIVERTDGHYEAVATECATNRGRRTRTLAGAVAWLLYGREYEVR